MALRAPKQWSLTKHESITSFENWRQNLQYTLSLDRNFAPFLVEGVQWPKKSNADPLRGFEDDNDDVPAATRRTAHQKCAHLELMLGQIANFCPVVSRNTITKNSTSLASIWQAIRLHFGFQSTGAHFLDLNNIKLEPDERPEDLFQRLTSFVEDNLLTVNSNITHHGEPTLLDEELSPSLENMIVLMWLRLINPELPSLVKQRYGPELRSKTLASLKPEISQALDSLLDEINTAADSRILRASASRFKTRSPNYPSRAPVRKPKSCPLCKQTGRPDRHYLSKCPFLPPEDLTYMTKSRLTTSVDEVASSDEEPPLPTFVPEPPDATCSTARIISRRVSTSLSPFVKVFYKHHPLTLTLDTGAETSMIKASIARQIGAPITKTTQQVLQADGITPMAVIGETHLTLSRSDLSLKLDALVVEDLDVDILAGTPFMSFNDISVRPAKNQVIVQGSEVLLYTHQSQGSALPTVRRTQAHVLRASAPSTILWPGDYLELDIPSDLSCDSPLAIEPRVTPSSSKVHSPDHMWPPPQLIEPVGNKIRLVNSTDAPHLVRRHDHICQALHTTVPENLATPPPYEPSTPPRTKPPTGLFSDAVLLDPDSLLPEATRAAFKETLKGFDEVFNPDYSGYNGSLGPFLATVNMGPVQPPQRKGRLPQYSHTKLAELQAKFDELEHSGVLRRPEDINVNVEYLNPSFLVKKPSGGHRLVTDFADVGRYSKPSPSLMPDVDSTLRRIAPWKYIIVSDLTNAFYQIPLSKPSMKYCGVATPFKGVRVYTRCAMGMPGSETALEEMMSRVLGDFIQEGFVAKLADDLYCGGNTPEELLSNWVRVLQALHDCNLRLSASKTVIAPKSTTILGWIWTQGSLSASPHRIAMLSSCPSPKTVKALRSFIGAYKVLGRVLPHCSQLLDPLESSIAGLQSADIVPWTDNLHLQFTAAQQALSTNQAIVLPRPSDTLWIVTDGSVSKHGIGATLYVSRQDKLHLAGFFSAKLRKHQVTWLPCEIEALSIAAAVKHFSPYLVQSKEQACVLTDSKPCVQASQKLLRGQFSASPRVTSFLSTVSRYQITLRHLAGSANLPSDFSSRNAPACDEPRCQVCTFINELEDCVVHSLSIHDIINKDKRLPFTTRSAWADIQTSCPDLRRVHAHLKQGTRPSKKLTNIKDVKRLLNVASISRDGLLVVKRNPAFMPPVELIVVPRSVLDGLLTALHIQLDHPSRHQLLLVVQRHFFALDLTVAINQITSSCHTCASLQKFPSTLISQSSDEPPEVVGITFAADVIRRNRQFILVLRECVTAFTSACLIPDETHSTLRDALIRLCVGQHPLDGPKAVIRVDPAPGFSALRNDQSLSQLGISLEIGRVKNVNKNPVAEKAVAEVEEEILRQEPGGGPITDVQLVLVIARLNARLRSLGLSARELWTKRNQFNNDPIPVSDHQLILEKNKQRQANHPHSEKSKNPLNKEPSAPSLLVGDIVYLHCDKSKSRARDRYIVTSIDGEWCYIKKFTGQQLRSFSYKVKLCECYRVPSTIPSGQRPTVTEDDYADMPEDSGDLHASPYQPPPSPPDLLQPHYLESPEELSCCSDQALCTPDTTVSSADIALSSPEPSNEPPLSPSQVPGRTRPQRSHRRPQYLDDYVLD